MCIFDLQNDCRILRGLMNWSCYLIFVINLVINRPLVYDIKDWRKHLKIVHILMIILLRAQAVNWTVCFKLLVVMQKFLMSVKKN